MVSTIVFEKRPNATSILHFELSPPSTYHRSNIWGPAHLFRIWGREWSDNIVHEMHPNAAPIICSESPSHPHKWGGGGAMFPYTNAYHKYESIPNRAPPWWIMGRLWCQQSCSKNTQCRVDLTFWALTPFHTYHRSKIWWSAHPFRIFRREWPENIVHEMRLISPEIRFLVQVNWTKLGKNKNIWAG